MMVLFPGTIVGLLPSIILYPVRVNPPGDWSWGQFASGLVMAAGLAVLLRCVWEFAHRGRGTLAVFDAPRKFVVSGPYRYVRNPMYVGVLLILLGECWFFWSASLLLYAGLFFVIVNMFIIGYEERALRAKFGAEFVEYCQNVGRWIPKPYRPSGKQFE